MSKTDRDAEMKIAFRFDHDAVQALAADSCPEYLSTVKISIVLHHRLCQKST